MIGTLHELSYSRNSLTCDLIEEFRTPIADKLCCKLINNKIVHEEDFEDRDGGVYLTKSGMKKVITSFEELMQKKFRTIIFQQVELYKEMIMGRQEYLPYFFK